MNRGIARAGVAAGVMLAAATVLTGCGDGRRCLEHASTLHTTTTIVNNVPRVQVVPVVYCVRYEESSK